MGTGIAKPSPSHSLELVRGLASRGTVSINGRARTFIQNHVGRYDTELFVTELISAIEPEHFEKSVPLHVIEGGWGDVYRNVPYDNETWYIKLTVTQEGNLRLSVLSANWEGFIH